MSNTYVLDKPTQDVFGERLTVPGSGGAKTVFNRRAGYNAIRFEVAAAARVGFVPKIGGIWIRSAAGVWRNLLTQEMVTGTRLIDAGSAGLTLGLATTARLYIGFVRKVNDLFVDVGATVNSVASVLTAENSDRVAPGGFTALTITDGTDAAGATLAADGNITFTVPAGRAWEPRILTDLFLGESGVPGENLFWLRFAISVALTAGTNLDQIAGFVEDDGAGTATGQQGMFRTAADHAFVLGDEVGAIQPIANGGGATTMDVTWLRH